MADIKNRTADIFSAKLLAGRLGGVAPIALGAGRHSAPVLGSVLIGAKDGRLAMTTTDLDMKIEGVWAYDGGDFDAVCVDAGSLQGVVRGLVKAKVPGELSLGYTGGEFIIGAGEDSYSLHGIDGREFPCFDVGEDALPWSFTIAVADWLRIMDRTRFAISADETRYYLNGIYLDKSRSGLRAVATDGYRLTWSDFGAGIGNGAAGQIISRRAVGEVYRLAKGASGIIRVEMGKTMIRFRVGDWTLTSKLIDGTFPDYRRIVPKNTGRWEVNRDELIAAIKKAASVFHKAPAMTTPMVKLNWNSGELSAHCSGKGGVKVRVVNFTHKPSDYLKKGEGFDNMDEYKEANKRYDRNRAKLDRIKKKAEEAGEPGYAMIRAARERGDELVANVKHRARREAEERALGNAWRIGIEVAMERAAPGYKPKKRGRGKELPFEEEVTRRACETVRVDKDAMAKADAEGKALLADAEREADPYIKERDKLMDEYKKGIVKLGDPPKLKGFIGFNPDFMLDALEPCGDWVVIEYESADDAFMIKDGESVVAQMPMRI